MRKQLFLTLMIIFVGLSTSAQAQILNRISNSAQRAAERAAERAVTKKVEQEVSTAVTKALEAPEKQAAEKSEPKTIVIQSEPAPYTGPVREAPKNADKFPFEHGSYVQTAEVLGIEVNTTIYFARSGDWQAIEDKSEIRVFGIRTVNDKMHIIKGNQHWEIDMAEKTGNYYELSSNPDDTDAAMKAALAGTPTEGVEITELGQENYIGFACRKVNIKYPALAMDMTCLTYGSLVLKSDGYVGPIKTATRITSIDLNAPPASKFEVPAGIQINK